MHGDDAFRRLDEGIDKSRCFEYRTEDMGHAWYKTIKLKKRNMDVTTIVTRVLPEMELTIKDEAERAILIQ